ncbi:Protein phosphatase 2C 1 [Boothiomyces sp. JEL0838]|nr:Protein phosphatase 2C 1 [Boothiomyces sp. JEL0838]
MESSPENSSVNNKNPAENNDKLLTPPGGVFKAGLIPKSPSNSLNKAPKPMGLDPGTEKTVLDSESETDTPVSWSTITNSSILLTVSDDNDDLPKKTQRKSKRSPNRDDSDSEDEDEHGNKIVKPAKEEEEGFNPAVDKDFLESGFKAGFSEDRNKKYRRTMEDSHTILYNFANMAGNGFFAVFDGHAGRTAADYCGDNFHKNFSNLLKENPQKSVSEILNDAFLQTDKQLSQKKGLHSGCTAVVAFLNMEVRDGKKKRVLYTANVGDARAVISRNGKAVRLSYDHKGSDVNESRRIVESGGFMMNNRVNGVLAVTRSLGDLSMKDWVIGSPYTVETEITEEDSVIILACDGIWDVCSDQSAIDLIADIKDPQEAADTLVDYALDNFSTDNLTAIVIQLNQSFE